MPAPAIPDKRLDRGLTLNRSRSYSRSATYETLTQNQVVYESFGAELFTNMKCAPGGGPPSFGDPPAQSRTALRTRHAPGYARPAESPRRPDIVPSRRDSDLEAFSHKPADGSVAPLAPQPSTCTKCLNLRFLSY